MTKSDIVLQISQKTGIEKAEVSETLGTLCKVIKNSLIEGEAIYIRVLGVLSLRKGLPKREETSKKYSCIYTSTGISFF